MKEGLDIEWRDTDKVIPYDRNPRHNDDAVDAVAKSLDRFGWRQPIVVDEAGVIIMGHTRLKAAQKLGHPQVPIHVAVGMDEGQARALRIADNKVGEIATWNTEALKLEVVDLKAMGVDLDALGMEAIEIEDLLAPAPLGGGGPGRRENAGLKDLTFFVTPEQYDAIDAVIVAIVDSGHAPSPEGSKYPRGDALAFLAQQFEDTGQG